MGRILLSVLCWKLPPAGVLVKLPQSMWLANNKLLLTDLEAGNPRSRHQDGWVKAPFLVQSQRLLAVSSHAGRG